MWRIICSPIPAAPIYRLDQPDATLRYWKSVTGIYVTFDSQLGRLYFPDGSFWQMDCVATGTEEDSGTMYPTVMQDTNGNQVIVRYQPGGAG